MSTSSVSTQGNLPTYSALKAVLVTTQSTSIGSNDHVKFDSVVFQTGSDIWMDTSTPYTNGAGPSIGRFTLKGGKTYRISTTVPVQMSAIGALQYRLYDVTNSAWIAGGAYSISPVGGNTVADTGGLNALVSPIGNTVYEVRIWSAANITNIFSALGEPHIVIETVASQLPYDANASFSNLKVSNYQVLKDNSFDNGGLHTYLFDINQNVAGWTTMLTITPTITTNTWYQATARFEMIGHTSGVGNATTYGAVWSMDSTNGAMSSGQIIAPTTAGAGPGQVRVLTSGSQWLVQAGSSNLANIFQGSLKVEIHLPHSAGSYTAFTIT